MGEKTTRLNPAQCCRACQPVRCFANEEKGRKVREDEGLTRYVTVRCEPHTFGGTTIVSGLFFKPNQISTNTCTGTTSRSSPSKRFRAALTPHENIYNLPNILTFSRLISAPVVGYLILHDQHLPALALFGYAGVTDLVDGWMARKYGLQTVVGTVIDPMADKALMTVVTVCLAVKAALPGNVARGSGTKGRFLSDD